jgi:hypothetical protein
VEGQIVMVIPYRDQRVLRRMTRVLGAADPHLAGMLAIFARLSAGEALPRREQIRGLLPRALLAVAAAAALAADLLGCAALRAARCARAVGGACVAAARSARHLFRAAPPALAVGQRPGVTSADGLGGGSHP